MEGAGGTIAVLGDGWVRKTQKRHARGKRLSVAGQLRIGVWAHKWLAEQGGALFAPAVRPSAHVGWSFEMEAIETEEEPWFLTAVPPHMRLYVFLFVSAAERAGFVLNDCEFYLQSDGRVAVIDWDQCSRLPVVSDNDVPKKIDG